jgi:hypothetical protein
MNSHAIDLRKWVGLREKEEAGREREKDREVCFQPF